MKDPTPEKITVSFMDGSKIDVNKGITLNELKEIIKLKSSYLVVAGKVNNYVKELSYNLNENCIVDFIDLSNEDGYRIYKRSICLVLIKAMADIFPWKKVVISHAISKGVFCEIKNGKELQEEDVIKIENRMNELVKEKLPFIKKTISIESAKEIFKKSGRMDKFSILENRKKNYVTVYECDRFEDYFYGYMVPDTSYLKHFSLRLYNQGIILTYPKKEDPDKLPGFCEQKKLFNIFIENKKWGQILGVENIGALNGIIKEGEGSNLIRISEALQEKKIAQIADMIKNSQPQKRVVLIAGPSSSGKTTFANRLAIQLRVNGLKPVTLSIDDYFVSREDTPKDEKGEYDFEALEALDLPLFNAQLVQLINGEEVEIPIFNFPNGRRNEKGRMLKINYDQIIIIEGIHGLNERLTSLIPRDKKFKIYVSALTSVNIDDHNKIPTTDTRIIRRIVRDYSSRGCMPVTTIKRWPSVRRGEEKNIFPFQEDADVMFNSSLIYELGVMKLIIKPLLLKIDDTNSEYSEARRLLEFLNYFLPINSKDIPSNSIIREFIGGCCFY